ncbi:MAG: hypothetical protein L6R28_25810, partial [Planctomycetes bacterium]|nr:hypothetical protein [Planctomycetota bacterium]
IIFGWVSFKFPNLSFYGMTRPRLPYLLSTFILIGLLLTGLSYCGRDNKPDVAFSTIERGLLDTRR